MRRRLAWAGAVATTATVLGGIAFAFRSANGETAPAGATIMENCGLGQLVSGHSKMQAYGPDWSLHRRIQISDYLR